jgi:hypothetical protein
MGMTVSVFRWGLGDCTNNGVSAVAGSLCVVNVRGLSIHALSPASR